MDSNTHSSEGPPRLDGLAAVADVDEVAALAATLDRLAARDLDQLPDPVRAARVLALRGLADRLEGLWLRELAGVDAHGAPSSSPPSRQWVRSHRSNGAASGRAQRT